MATTHTNLNPSVYIRKGRGREISVSYSPAPASRPCSVTRDMVVEEATVEDYRMLAHLHYRDHGVVAPLKFYKLRKEEELAGVRIGYNYSSYIVSRGGCETRTYIFTKAEEEALLSWLEGGEETPLVTMTLSRVRNADRLILHIPYDPDLYAELNVERFELGKTGKLLFSHPEGTHDDRFWALTLAVYASESAPSPPLKPIARVI